MENAWGMGRGTAPGGVLPPGAHEMPATENRPMATPQPRRATCLRRVVGWVVMAGLRFCSVAYCWAPVTVTATSKATPWHPLDAEWARSRTPGTEIRAEVVEAGMLIPGLSVVG